MQSLGTTPLVQRRIPYMLKIVATSTPIELHKKNRAGSRILKLIREVSIAAAVVTSNWLAAEVRNLLCHTVP